jgi:hypothetical protein
VITGDETQKKHKKITRSHLKLIVANLQITLVWTMVHKPLAALRWFPRGEVHGVANRALHPLERTSHCPATACSVMVLAALVLFGTAGVSSPAIAQVKAPTKSKLKPPVKADPTDGVADQLNAKWLQENGRTPASSRRPAVVPASYATPRSQTTGATAWSRAP